MRKIFTLLAAGILTANLASAQSLTPELFHYNFDGITSTSIPNLASNPPAGTATGTMLGGYTVTNSGICQGSLLGAGGSATTDYVNTNWAPNLGNGAWTISFRTSNVSASATLFYIFGDAGTTSWRVFTNGVAGANNWIMRGPMTDVLISGGAVLAPTMNTWVYDPIAGNIKAYLNGSLVNTVAQAALNVTGTGPLKVGGYSANTTLPAGGMMDDFRIYSRALNATEVLALYNGDTLTNFLGGNAAFCAGDSVSLGISNSYTTMSWSTGATTNTIMVDSVGTYTMTVSDLCTYGVDSVSVVETLPLAPGFLGSDITICTNDTAILIAGTPQDLVVWSTGDTANTVLASTAGTYSVDLTNACGVQSDTIELIQSNIVYTGFLQYATTTPCFGQPVTLDAFGQFMTYAWSTGDTTPSVVVIGSGVYTVTVSDDCGSGSESVTIVEQSGPTAGFSFSQTGFDVTFANTSTGGNGMSYAWDFGDGNTSTLANPLHTYANGAYFVTMTVTDSCGSDTYTDSVYVNVVGIAQALDLEVKLYPNPASDKVIVSANVGSAQDLTLSVVSLQGQVLVKKELVQQAGEFTHEINLSDVAAGSYLLVLKTDQGSVVSNLSVTK